MNNDYIITEINPENLSLQVTYIDLTDYGLQPTWKIKKVPVLYFNNCTDEWSFLLRVSASECFEEWQRQKRMEGEWRLA